VRPCTDTFRRKALSSLIVEHFQFNPILAISPQAEGSGLSTDIKLRSHAGPNSWVPQNMDKTIGDLGLTNEQEDQLVAFMKTLTDGYKPQQAHMKK